MKILVKKIHHLSDAKLQKVHHLSDVNVIIYENTYKENTSS